MSSDRLGEVLSGSAVLRAPDPAAQEGGADSAPAPVAGAPTDVSAAGIVLENPPVSEGVASAGLPPQAPLGEFVGEFVPSTVGEQGTHSLAAGFQGETSGLHDGGTAGGSTYGFGETGAGSMPMDFQQPGTASAQVGPGRAAASYHASRAEPEAAGGGAAGPSTHHFKRKMSEMGEVEGETEAAGAADEGLAAQASAGESGDAPGGGLNRVPSDIAMVVGDALGPPAAADNAAEFDSMLPDDCDSNMARAIQASLDEARAAQQRQEAVAAAVGGGEGGAPAAAAAPGEAVLDSAAAADPNRPSDAAIIAWENEIRESEVRRVPLMGDREPLAALAAEYAAGSAIYQQKIGKLGEAYGSIRRTRGDGNCFFRSFFFGYLEHLLLSGDGGERDRAMRELEGLKKALVEVGGYDEIVLETPVDMVLQLLRSVASPLDPLTIEGLEANVRDEDLSGYPVWLLRMVTSCEIKRRADFFAPFIIGLSDLDVATFCSKCVDPMGEESDHVQLVALTDALKVPIRVVYLDRSLAPGGGGDGNGGVHVDEHDFIPEGCPPPARPRVHLLYRPGHYDLLYPRHE
ncbi:hypothetical protein ABPG75_002146 [Micractinium tetrahymenae]